jgi:zinc D-Ala-D-Ala carboxypeptidase
VIFKFDSEQDIPAGFWRWSPYVTPHEFACHHCGKIIVEENFLDRFVAARKAYGKPVTITSGYRCPEWDAIVGTSKQKGAGPHTTGHAIDVAIFGPNAHSLLYFGLKFSMQGVGVKQTGPIAGRILHFDDLPGDALTPRPYLWTY